MRGTGNRKSPKPPDNKEQSQRFVEEARKLGVAGVSDGEFGRIFDVILGSMVKPKPKSKSRKAGG